MVITRFVDARVNGFTLFAGSLISAFTRTLERARTGILARGVIVTRFGGTSIDSDTRASVGRHFKAGVTRAFVLSGAGFGALRVGTAHARYFTAVIDFRTRLTITEISLTAFAGVFSRAGGRADCIRRARAFHFFAVVDRFALSAITLISAVAFTHVFAGAGFQTPRVFVTHFGRFLTVVDFEAVLTVTRIAGVARTLYHTHHNNSTTAQHNH